ncbi:MAG: serine/threonine protein kinase [Gammaproteobacteria bacterium]
MQPSSDHPSDHPYSGLTPDQVINTAEALGFNPDARVFALNSYENRVYQVGQESGPFLILKFYRPGRWSREQILEEHLFTAELAELEVPVVPPMSLAGASTLVDIGDFSVAVFPQFLGRAPELDSLDDLLVMGRFIGRIHAVGANGKFRHRHELGIARFAEQSRAFLLEQQFIPGELEQAYAAVSSQLIERLHDIFSRHGNYPRLRIHGDCHVGNVLWRDDTPHFVDFDDAMTGPAIQDIWMLLSGDRDQRQGQLLEIVEGYNEFYDFRPAELVLVEALRSLRLMHYSAWLARRWQDPAFPLNFPWFNTVRYWSEHVLELKEQLAALDEPPLQLF